MCHRIFRLQCQDDEATGSIKYERFEPVMTKVLLEKKYVSASEETILRAFQVRSFPAPRRRCRARPLLRRLAIARPVGLWLTRPCRAARYAGQVLDTAKKGFIDEETLQKFLTEEGESFSMEDFEEMMSAAKDLERNVVSRCAQSPASLPRGRARVPVLVPVPVPRGAGGLLTDSTVPVPACRSTMTTTLN